MKKTFGKRLLSLALTLVMVIGLLGTGVFATGGTTVELGSAIDLTGNGGLPTELDGYATWNSGTKTLAFSQSVTINISAGTDSGIILPADSIIQVENGVTVTVSGIAAGIMGEGSLTISGGGILNVNGKHTTASYGIAYDSNNSKLSLTDTVTVNATAAGASSIGVSVAGEISISNAATLTAKGKTTAIACASVTTNLTAKGGADEQADSELTLKLATDGVYAYYLGDVMAQYVKFTATGGGTDPNPAPESNVLIFKDNNLYLGSSHSDTSAAVFDKQTDKWSVTTNTLTLKGLTFETTNQYGLYIASPCTIVLEGNNTIASTNSSSGYGIYVAAATTIQGDGTLSAAGSKSAIIAHADAGTNVSLTIAGGTINAMSDGTGGYGIRAYKCAFTVQDGIVNATSTGDNGYGIDVESAGSSFTVSKGTVTATCSGAGTYSTGIYSNVATTINGGTVTATGGSKGYEGAEPTLTNVTATGGADDSATGALTFIDGTNDGTYYQSDGTTVAKYVKFAPSGGSTPSPTPAKTLSSIEITTPPTKTTYIVGDTLDLTGMKVTATYSDNSTKEITTGFTTDPADGTVLATSNTSVTVSYTEDDVTKTATQAITVTGPITLNATIDLKSSDLPQALTDAGVTWADNTLRFTKSVDITVTTAPIALLLPAGAIIDIPNGVTVDIKSTGNGTNDKDVVGIDCYGDLTVTGGGTLNVTVTGNPYQDSTTPADDGGSYGIWCEGKLALTGSVKVNVETTPSTAREYNNEVAGISAETISLASGTGLTAFAQFSSIYGCAIIVENEPANVTAKGGSNVGHTNDLTFDDDKSTYTYAGTIAQYVSLTAAAPAPAPSGGAAPSVTVPVSSDEGSVTVSATVSGSRADVTVTDAQLAEVVSDAAGTGVVTVDLSALANVDAAKLPAGLVAAANSATGAEGLRVLLPTGAVELDKAALDSIATGDDVVVSVQAVAPAALEAAHASMLGFQAENAVVVDVSILKNGVRLSDFAGGRLTVRIPYTPAEGEDAGALTVWFLTDEGGVVPMNGQYNAAAGCVEFVTDHLSDYAVVSFPFADVAETHWAYLDVAYVYNNGLFDGVADAAFAPDAAMTRAMLVTVLWRLEGEPIVDAVIPFTDVAEDLWYTEAVRWAASHGIVEGYSETGFGPNDPISREQIATVLWRYSGAPELAGYTGLAGYADAGGIGSWAFQAMCWAHQTGLINGRTETSLVPGGAATRAEVAAILHRVCENEK